MTTPTVDTNGVDLNLARNFAKQGCKLCNGKGFLHFISPLGRHLYKYCYKSGCSLRRMKKYIFEEKEIKKGG